MNFTPSTRTAEEKRSERNSLFFFLALSLGLVALGIAILTLGLHAGPRGNWGLIGFFFIFMSPMTFIMATMVPEESQIRRMRLRAYRIRNALEAHYGLALSADEFAALNYPLDEPSEDFRVFGSIPKQKQLSGASFVEHTVYLVWADGQMQLSESEDGKNFSELRSAELQPTN